VPDPKEDRGYMRKVITIIVVTAFAFSNIAYAGPDTAQDTLRAQATAVDGSASSAELAESLKSSASGTKKALTAINATRGSGRRGAKVSQRLLDQVLGEHRHMTPRGIGREERNVRIAEQVALIHDLVAQSRSTQSRAVLIHNPHEREGAPQPEGARNITEVMIVAEEKPGVLAELSRSVADFGGTITRNGNWMHEVRGADGPDYNVYVFEIENGSIGNGRFTDLTPLVRSYLGKEMRVFARRASKGAGVSLVEITDADRIPRTALVGEFDSLTMEPQDPLGGSSPRAFGLTDTALNLGHQAADTILMLRIEDFINRTVGGLDQKAKVPALKALIAQWAKEMGKARLARKGDPEAEIDIPIQVVNGTIVVKDQKVSVSGGKKVTVKGATIKLPQGVSGFARSPLIIQMAMTNRIIRELVKEWRQGSEGIDWDFLYKAIDITKRDLGKGLRERLHNIMIDYLPRLETTIKKEIKEALGAIEGIKDIKRIAFCGMGGSGAGGNVLSAMVDELGLGDKIEVHMVKDYQVPEEILQGDESETLYIMSSFSGETDEILAIVEGLAVLGKDKVVCIASGDGASLGNFARSKDWPFISLIEEGALEQPREALPVTVLKVKAILEYILKEKGIKKDGHGVSIKARLSTEEVFRAIKENFRLYADVAQKKSECIYEKGLIPVIITDGKTLSGALATRMMQQLTECPFMPCIIYTQDEVERYSIELDPEVFSVFTIGDVHIKSPGPVAPSDLTAIGATKRTSGSQSMLWRYYGSEVIVSLLAYSLASARGIEPSVVPFITGDGLSPLSLAYKSFTKPDHPLNMQMQEDFEEHFPNYARLSAADDVEGRGEIINLITTKAGARKTMAARNRLLRAGTIAYVTYLPEGNHNEANSWLQLFAMGTRAEGISYVLVVRQKELLDTDWLKATTEYFLQPTGRFYLHLLGGRAKKAAKAASSGGDTELEPSPELQKRIRRQIWRLLWCPISLERGWAADDLKALGPAARSAIPALVKASGSRDKNIRIAAREARKLIGRAKTDGLDSILRSARRRNENVRVAAMQEIAKLGAVITERGGPDYDRTVSAVVRALEDKSPSVRDEAVRALEELNPLPEDVIVALTSRLRYENRDTYATYAKALGVARPATDDATGSLVAGLRSFSVQLLDLDTTNLDLFLSVAQALGNIGRENMITAHGRDTSSLLSGVLRQYLSTPTMVPISEERQWVDNLTTLITTIIDTLGAIGFVSEDDVALLRTLRDEEITLTYRVVDDATYRELKGTGSPEAKSAAITWAETNRTSYLGTNKTGEIKASCRRALHDLVGEPLEPVQDKGGRPAGKASSGGDQRKVRLLLSDNLKHHQKIAERLIRVLRLIVSRNPEFHDKLDALESISFDSGNTTESGTWKRDLIQDFIVRPGETEETTAVFLKSEKPGLSRCLVSIQPALLEDTSRLIVSLGRELLGMIPTTLGAVKALEPQLDSHGDAFDFVGHHMKYYSAHVDAYAYTANIQFLESLVAALDENLAKQPQIITKSGLVMTRDTVASLKEAIAGERASLAGHVETLQSMQPLSVVAGDGSEHLTLEGLLRILESFFSATAHEGKIGSIIKKSTISENLSSLRKLYPGMRDSLGLHDDARISLDRIIDSYVKGEETGVMRELNDQHNLTLNDRQFIATLYYWMSYRSRNRGNGAPKTSSSGRGGDVEAVRLEMLSSFHTSPNHSSVLNDTLETITRTKGDAIRRLSEELDTIFFDLGDPMHPGISDKAKFPNPQFREGRVEGVSTVFLKDEDGKPIEALVTTDPRLYEDPIEFTTVFVRELVGMIPAHLEVVRKLFEYYGSYDKAAVHLARYIDYYTAYIEARAYVANIEFLEEVITLLESMEHVIDGPALESTEADAVAHTEAHSGFSLVIEGERLALQASLQQLAGMDAPEGPEFVIEPHKTSSSGEPTTEELAAITRNFKAAAGVGAIGPTRIFLDNIPQAAIFYQGLRVVSFSHETLGLIAELIRRARAMDVKINIHAQATDDNSIVLTKTFPAVEETAVITFPHLADEQQMRNEASFNELAKRLAFLCVLSRYDQGAMGGDEAVRNYAAAMNHIKNAIGVLGIGLKGKAQGTESDDSPNREATIVFQNMPLPGEETEYTAEELIRWAQAREDDLVANSSISEFLSILSRTRAIATKWAKEWRFIDNYRVGIRNDGPHIQHAVAQEQVAAEREREVTIVSFPQGKHMIPPSMIERPDMITALVVHAKGHGDELLLFQGVSSEGTQGLHDLHELAMRSCRPITEADIAQEKLKAGAVAAGPAGTQTTKRRSLQWLLAKMREEGRLLPNGDAAEADVETDDTHPGEKSASSGKPLTFDEQIEAAERFLADNEIDKKGRLTVDREKETLSLNLYSTTVSDISALQGLVNLTRLNLSNTDVSDITPLQGLGNLRVLNLSDTSVSNITPLHALLNLTELNFHDTDISDESIYELFAAHPNPEGFFVKNRDREIIRYANIPNEYRKAEPASGEKSASSGNASTVLPVTMRHHRAMLPARQIMPVTHRARRADLSILSSA